MFTWLSSKLSGVWPLGPLTPFRVGGVSQLSPFLQNKLSTENTVRMMKTMMAVVVVRTVKALLASVRQQDEQQAAEDAGEAAVKADQQSGRRAVRLIAVTA